MSRRCIDCHFNEYIIKNTNFRDYCELTVGTETDNEKWFKNFCQLDQNQKIMVDKYCRSIVTYTIETYRKTCAYCNGNDKAIFWNAIYEDMTKDGEDNFHNHERKQELPSILQSNRTCNYILMEILVKLVEQWLQIDINELVTYEGLCEGENKSKEVTGHMINEEVHIFVGFAVSSRIRLLRKELLANRKERNQLIVDTKKKKLLVLKKMRILHKDAMKNETYRNNYYSPRLQLRNYGGLTLLSREFFEFGKEMMEQIRVEVNLDKVEKECNCVYSVGNGNIHKNKNLIGSFVTVVKKECSHIAIDESVVASLYHELVEKTYRSKFKQVSFNITQITCTRRVKENVDSSHRNMLKIVTAKADKERGDILLGKKKKRKEIVNK